MVEGLLLDRIDTEAARSAVRRENDLVILAGSHEAESALPLAQLAGTGTDVTLDAAVIEGVPVLRGDGRAGSLGTHAQSAQMSPTSGLATRNRSPVGTRTDASCVPASTTIESRSTKRV